MPLSALLAPTAVLEDQLARAEHREAHASGQISDIQDILSSRKGNAADDDKVLLDRIQDVAHRPIPPFSSQEQDGAGPIVDIASPTKVRLSRRPRYREDIRV